MLPRSTALLFVLWFGLSVLLIHSLDNCLGHVVDHLVGHAGVNADPESIVHDKVGVGQLARHAVGVGAADLVKAGVLDEVAAEQQTGLHVVALHIAGHGVAVQTALRLDRDQEAEPGRAAVGSRFRQDQLVGGGLQRGAQAVPVVAAALDEGRELLQLLAADGGLHVGDLEVIAKVAVDVLVVVALGQLAELTVKAVAAEVILAGGADAVAAPVAEG